MHRTRPPSPSAPLPALRSGRLLGQLRERLRYLHYSLRTEEAYLHWVRFFVNHHGLRHPRDMGKAEIESFLSMLANERRVSVSTHKQALSALMFLYREVLGVQLPWLEEIGRPQASRRIPSVLTQAEVGQLLAALTGEPALVAALLYGSGLRLTEALALRTKDVDFHRRAVVVRESKGGKDRVVMLPAALLDPLREQLVRSRQLWELDRKARRPTSARCRSCSATAT